MARKTASVLLSVLVASAWAAADAPLYAQVASEAGSARPLGAAGWSGLELPLTGPEAAQVQTALADSFFPPSPLSSPSPQAGPGATRALATWDAVLRPLPPAETAGAARPKIRLAAAAANTPSTVAAGQTASANIGAAPRKAAATLTSVRNLKDQGDALFDASFDRADDSSLEPAPQTQEGTVLAAPGAAPASRKAGALARLARSPLGRLLPSALATRLGRDPPPPKIKTTFDADDFGGPPRLKTGLTGRVLYGVKWGVNLVGIVALLQWTLKPLIDALQWQLHAPHSWLSGLGRVTLLTGIGPDGLREALEGAPFHFLFLQLPRLVFWEELYYRVLGFGLLCAGLALLRPLSKAGLTLISDIPNLFNLRRCAAWGLKLASWLSSKAFLLATLASAAGFAWAHFAAWGIDPFQFILHGSLGAGIAYAAYRTRSLLTALSAHFTYNFLTLFAGVLASHFGMIEAARTCVVLQSLGALAFLWYNRRSYLKEKAFAEAQAGALPASKARWRRWLPGIILVPALLAGGAELYKAQKAGQLDFYSPVPVRLFDQASPQDGMAGGQGGAAPAPAVPAPPMSTVELVEKNRPAVVMIYRLDGTSLSAGSGFIIDPAGILITNAHVVGESAAVTVRFVDGREASGKVLAANHDRDIAIVALPPSSGGWPTVKVGDSGKLREGEDIIAMGYPLALPFSVTKGIVSGLGGSGGFEERGTIYVDWIQHDASITHGNSGGPLFNAQGEVVGINSAGPEGAGAIGFSIPSRDFQKALAQFAATGKIDSAWLGIIIDASRNSDHERGVRVEAVLPGSQAAAAGLKAGDVVIGIGDQRLPSGSRYCLSILTRLVAAMAPGEKLEMKVLRLNGKAFEVKSVPVALGGKPR